MLPFHLEPRARRDNEKECPRDPCHPESRHLAPLPPTTCARLGFGLKDWFCMLFADPPDQDRPPYDP
jgi:hypothetical protein